MENKINIAELLKDCPKGMELNCLMYENVTLVEVSEGYDYPIVIETPSGQMFLSKYGCFSKNELAKCIIFPKGKTTWVEFEPPYEFKDGDIVTWKDSMGSLVACIYKERLDISFNHHIALYKGGLGIIVNGEIILTNDELRLATEEEKAKLFDAIKANGYKWNAETKTLELTSPNKFDITTLKPFDKVLVRDNNEQFWTCDWFSFHDTKQVYPFVCVGHYVSQCIPYEENQHLLGTTNDCDNFYKTWE